MNIRVIGISHHTALVEVREAFSLPGDLAGKLLRAVKDEGVFAEAMVLDTCNRNEVYFVANQCDDPTGYLLGHIARLKQMPAITDTSAIYQHRGRDAAEHLFRVSATLDSQIVGEHQIPGQVRDGYRLARENQTAKLLLNKLLHWTFRVGKRAQAETDIGRGSASVAQTAVDLSQHVFASLAGKTVLLVGAGRTGELVAKAVVRNGASKVIVANRSIDNARTVAANVLEFSSLDAQDMDLPNTAIRCPALIGMIDHLKQAPAPEADRKRPKPATQAISLEEIPDVIDQVDLVISATGSPGIVLKAEQLAAKIAKSRRSLFLIDIAVPRDIDPALGRLDNVYLYNMDDLDRLVARNVESRREEIPRVEAIVASELEGFCNWFASLEIAPPIKLLQQRFAAMQEEEIARYGGKFCDADQEQLEKFTRSVCNKILHHHIAFLRDFSDEASLHERLETANTIRKMFHLDDLENDSE